MSCYVLASIIELQEALLASIYYYNAFHFNKTYQLSYTCLYWRQSHIH